MSQDWKTMTLIDKVEHLYLLNQLKNKRIEELELIIDGIKKSRR